MAQNNLIRHCKFSKVFATRTESLGPRVLVIFLTLFICLQMRDLVQTFYDNNIQTIVTATSINYGTNGQQSNTDTSQLMPKLCQNQSVICEGSFCIPGVRKCVCDLRMPVQFGRFCLRQVDIETKCFVTNQCNHTIKDAVCIDLNSNAILDPDSSKFKLEQWQQLNELRQLSAGPKEVPKQQSQIITIPTTREPYRFTFDNYDNSGYNVEAREDVYLANARNSPYEINYDTQELLDQNHTRRRTNHSDKPPMIFSPASNFNQNTDTQAKSNSPLTGFNQSMSPVTTVTTVSTPSTRITTSTLTTIDPPTTGRSTISETLETVTSDLSAERLPTTTLAYTDSINRKKVVIKSPNWPPGVCSCPFGFMFDSMLRKCLAVSLADSHCQVDSDCRQILMTHCSTETKKCECDEPLVWEHKELACVRPKPTTTTENPLLRKENGSFVDNLLPPLILAKLLPDYTMMLFIFVIVVIIGTLIILKLTVKCFSSSSSALISPKSGKKKSGATNLPPRSPYATLRRPDHKPSSQLSNFTQATRGRILNYDFEQEGIEPEVPHSIYPSGTSTTPRPNRARVQEKTGTMRTNKSQKHPPLIEATIVTKNSNSQMNEALNDQILELNDNISVSQMESEGKSENSVLEIPGPPPIQQPPYMLASAMKGQGSAIAAAAAAVANKRMQMAQRKNLDQENSGNLTNGSPVFL